VVLNETRRWCPYRAARWAAASSIRYFRGLIPRPMKRAHKIFGLVQRAPTFSGSLTDRRHPLLQSSLLICPRSSLCRSPIRSQRSSATQCRRGRAPGAGGRGGLLVLWYKRARPPRVRKRARQRRRRRRARDPVRGRGGGVVAVGKLGFPRPRVRQRRAEATRRGRTFPAAPFVWSRGLPTARIA
jgi:hypothetical protein